MFVASIIKPIALIVHGKPAVGKSCCTTIGKTTPPVHDPNAAKPTAKDLFLAKYVVSRLMVGQKCNPFAIPVQSACERKSCQYLVAKLVAKIPSNCNADPVI